MAKLTLFTDGSAAGNHKGRAGWALVLLGEVDQMLAADSGAVDDATPHEAEAVAVQEGVTLAARFNGEHLTIHTDCIPWPCPSELAGIPVKWVQVVNGRKPALHVACHREAGRRRKESRERTSFTINERKFFFHRRNS